MPYSIDSTAIVDPSVNLGNGVSIGAYTVIGPGVEIGDDTRIGPHVVMQGPARIGKNNRIYQFASVGDDPQDKKYSGESSELCIGDNNVIREFCTINRGTAAGGGKTLIGNDNWIMAYVHIAHDCVVGNGTIFVNGAMLGGHARIDDYVILSANVLVQQFCRVGRHAFAARGVMLTKDLTPFTLAAGSPAKTLSLNKKGLQRHNFDPELVLALERCYKKKVRETNNPDIPDIDDHARQYPEVREFIQFIEGSGHGILR